MNLDHFMLLDSHVAKKLTEEQLLNPRPKFSNKISTWEEHLNIQASGPYLSELREVLSKIPKAPETPKKKGVIRDGKKKGKKGKKDKNKKGKKDPKKQHK